MTGPEQKRGKEDQGKKLAEAKKGSDPSEFILEELGRISKGKEGLRRRIPEEGIQKVCEVRKAPGMKPNRQAAAKEKKGNVPKKKKEGRQGACPRTWVRS